jgi:hypothetical protein
MGHILKRFLQTLRLEREAYVWMDFNDRATGDALILVAVTGVLKFAGFFGGLGSLFNFGAWDLLVSFVLAALIQWLLYSGIAWAIVRYIVQGSGEYATYLRFTGFAYPTTLLSVGIAIAMNRAGFVPFALGFAWFIFIIARGIEYESDLPRERAIFVAVGALVGLLVVDAIFGFSPITRT